MSRSKPTPAPITAIAACVFELPAVGEPIQLFPAGQFKARDGRPFDVEGGHWIIDAGIASQVMARAAARSTDLVIDYEHQTLNTEKNGQPAPAAGWLQGADMEWREGQGLYATRPNWTVPAAEFIERREYRYLSPVFAYDTRTGAVLELLHVAITNNPAIDGMESLALAAARFQPAAPANQPAKEKHGVNREQLIALLKLASDASEEDIQAALAQMQANADQVPQLEQALAAAKAGTPDPAKFVPLAVVEDLKKDIAVLKATQIGGEVEALVKAGLDDGRLLPAQEEWARGLGATNLAALRTYLKTTPAIAALKSQQTGGKAPVPEKVEQLDAETLAVCRSLGVEPKDYLATLQA